MAINPRLILMARRMGVLSERGAALAARDSGHTPAPETDDWTEADTRDAVADWRAMVAKHPAYARFRRYVNILGAR